MIDHRKEVIKQIDNLKKSLNIIDLKIALYDSDDNSPLSSIFLEQEDKK